MVRHILFTVAFLIALFAELALDGELALWGVRPPFAGAMLFFWFWDMRLYRRLFLAFLGGILMDSISLHPFGTNTAVFMVIAANTGALRYFFSNIESLITRAVGISVNIFLFINLAALMGYLISVANTLSPTLTGAFLAYVFFSSLIWALVLPAFFLFLVMAGKFVYEKIKIF